MFGVIVAAAVFTLPCSDSGVLDMLSSSAFLHYSRKLMNSTLVST